MGEGAVGSSRWCQPAGLGGAASSQDNHLRELDLVCSVTSALILSALACGTTLLLGKRCAHSPGSQAQLRPPGTAVCPRGPEPLCGLG